MAQVAPVPQKMTDRFDEALIIRQEWAAMELCGCEAKNRYRVHKSAADKSARSASGENSMYINEESACLERICCGPNRSLTLVVHQGGDKGESL